MENTLETTPLVLMVFTGLVIGTGETAKGKKKNEVCGVWHELSADKNEWKIDPNKRTIYGMKNMPFCRPGSIYTFEQPKPGTIRVNTAKYVGQWPDEQKIIEWQVLFEAFKSEQNAKKQENSDVMKNLPWEALEPFRNAYHRANSFQQSAMIVKLLDSVRNYR